MKFNVAGVTTQTDISGQYILQLESDNRQLREEVYRLRKEAEGFRFTEEGCKSNAAMTSFYTGLPAIHILFAVYHLAAQHVQHTTINALTKFQELMVTLIRLRLNVPEQDLAYRCVTLLRG